MGEENERGRYVERGFVSDVDGVPITTMLRVWEADPSPKPGAYAGPCRGCDGLGRLRPHDWQDGVFDTNGALLDPGTNPDLQRIAAAQRGAR